MSLESKRYYLFLIIWGKSVNSGPLLSLRGARFTTIEGSEANWIYHCEKHLKSQINSCLFNAFPEEVLLSIAADPPYPLSPLRPCLLYNPSPPIRAKRIRVGVNELRATWGQNRVSPTRVLELNGGW